MADFDLLILLPAAIAAKAQLHGLQQLSRAAGLAAGSAGSGGSRAAAHFNNFDYHASQAIEHGEVDIEVPPLDVGLGVLPLAQLGLWLWFARHSYHPGAS